MQQIKDPTIHAESLFNTSLRPFVIAIYKAYNPAGSPSVLLPNLYLNNTGIQKNKTVFFMVL